MTQPVVADIISLMERLAPSDLAESWDNCGLQVGCRRWPVKKIWVALDPLPSVVEAASCQEVDLIITHHPLMIKPISSVDIDMPPGGVIAKALVSQTALFAAHTNLDSAADGINHILAEAFGLMEHQPMVPAKTADSHCNGTSGDNPTGLGRIGRLDTPLRVDEFVRKIRQVLNFEEIRVAGDQGMVLEKVAVCSGGGGSLLDVFLRSDAQAYVSGDLRYHDARAAEDAGRVLIDIGHFPSEHVVLDVLAQRLRSQIKNAGWPVEVETCTLEREPFVLI